MPGGGLQLRPAALDFQSAGDAAVPPAHDVAARLVAHTDTAAASGATGRRIASTIALDLARTARARGLSPAVAMQLRGQLAGWAKRLAAATGSGELADWQRGLGATLSDREALDAALALPAPAVPPGMPIG